MCINRFNCNNNSNNNKKNNNNTAVYQRPQTFWTDASDSGVDGRLEGHSPAAAGGFCKNVLSASGQL